ncbi:hypothetical protein BG006_002291 [Podila minutissima]|uniref:Uncharacterized protein n=1 Tax=Podila minutissima TaxID=64525 RepID=A0A9P5S9D4_9FUNG|nr:hypothetical protein BG006_002291 [Podila minutissima]
MSTSLFKKTHLRSPSDSSFADISDKLRNWVHDRLARNQSVKLESFVVRFNYHDRASARRAYANILDSDQLTASREYDFFTRNLDDLFWSKRLLCHSSKITLMKTAVLLQQAALKQVHLLSRSSMEKLGNNEGSNHTEGLEANMLDDGSDNYADGSDNYRDDDQNEEQDHESDHDQGQDEHDGDQDYY